MIFYLKKDVFLKNGQFWGENRLKMWQKSKKRKFLCEKWLQNASNLKKVKNGEEMITVICGIPGAGKTSYMTYLLANQIIEHGKEDWFCCKREVDKLREGGFKCLDAPPQYHVCFADYSVKLNMRTKPYNINGFEIGLDNPYYETVFLPPYSSIFLDEAQRYYDSRMTKYLRSCCYNWFQLHRHNDYNVYMVCQRLGNIDLNIRGNAENFVVVDGTTTEKDSFGFVRKITWKIRTFHSPDTAEAYMLAKERNEEKDFGKATEVTTELPIFSYYNSKSNKPAFFAGNLQRPFEYYTEDGYEFTLDSFTEFNNKHMFSAPQGFWKNAEYDKKILKQYEVEYGN